MTSSAANNPACEVLSACDGRRFVIREDEDDSHPGVMVDWDRGPAEKAGDSSEWDSLDDIINEYVRQGLTPDEQQLMKARDKTAAMMPEGWMHIPRDCLRGVGQAMIAWADHFDANDSLPN
jgi:hypothetical protein